MNGRQRILAAMAGEKTDCTPVAIDYMGLFLEERIERHYVEAYRDRLEREGRVTLDPDEDVELRARAILAAYQCFQERDDWLYAPPGPDPAIIRSTELVKHGDEFYGVNRISGACRRLLRPAQESKTEEMRERYERMRWGSQSLHQLDEILEAYKRQALATHADTWLTSSLIRHTGGKFFTYTGATAPFVGLNGLISFEDMLRGLYDAPATMIRVMDAILEIQIKLAQSFKDAGGDGIRVEECFASADIISPAMYERFALPYEDKLCRAIKGIGLKVILYFCGDVMPRLPFLCQLPIDALMVEESKKDFIIEIGAVREAVGPDLCLFGNIDVYEIVEKGTPAQIRAEVARQVRSAGAHGRFIVGVGSPLTLVTPPARVDLLIRVARETH